MKICFVSSEAHPFAKTGGLGDVVSALVRYLNRHGHDIRLFLPLYSRSLLDQRDLLPVDRLRNVSLRLGGREVTFSVYTAPLPGGGPTVHLIHYPPFYDRPTLYTNDADEPLRFALLSRASIECCQRLGFAPDVFHCNDWHTALIPLYLKALYAWDSLFRQTRTALTIHNIGYQGVFPARVAGEVGVSEPAYLLDEGDLRAGRINFLKTGILHAGAITTVSPTYAREIQTADLGVGLDGLLRARRNSLVGILNGVDYDLWSPETDPYIPRRYSADTLEAKEENKQSLLSTVGLPYAASAPVLGIISRLTAQKGFDLCFENFPALLAQRDVRIVALGAGESRYEDFFQGLQRRFPQKVCFYRGHSNELAHRIEAGADLFVMPSRYEPCGLNQMYSLKYGTVPLVRRTGGLADTVIPFDAGTGKGTGFVFEHFTAAGLRWALQLALRTWADRSAWKQLQSNGMAQDFSWEKQGPHYIELYARLTGIPT